MSAAFTPGPWQAETVNEQQKPHFGIVRQGEYRPLALVTESADARLIAAAPDLLNACGTAFDFLGGCDDAADIRDTLLAAMLKAQGQS